VNGKENRAVYVDAANPSADKSLYVRSLNDLKEQPRGVDSKVISYRAAPNLKQVLYLKDPVSMELYMSDFEEKTLIDNDIRLYYADYDLDKIVYDKNSGGVFVKSGNDEKVVVDGTGVIRYVSPDLKNIFFVKSNEEGKGSLFLWKEGNTPIEIATDILVNEGYFFPEGQAYYVTIEDRQVDLYSYVDDDLKKKDKKNKRPTKPRPPKEPTYPEYDYDETDEERTQKQEQYERDYEAYEIALEQHEADLEQYEKNMTSYREKEERDSLRKQLKAEKHTETVRVLHYFDGANSTNVTEQLGAVHSYADTLPAATYTTFFFDPDKKRKFSQVSSPDDVSQGLDDDFKYSDTLVAVISGVAKEVPKSSDRTSRFSWDGQFLWYFGEYSEENQSGVLYRVPITGNTFGEPEQVDIDVTASTFYISQDGAAIYFKNYNSTEKTGDCYINGRAADANVAVDSIAVDKEWASYYYLAQYNPKTGVGILKRFTGEQSEEIAKDVRSFISVKPGETITLEKYSFAEKKGILAYYDEEDKRTELDKDVNDIIPIRNQKDRYSYVRELAYFNEAFYFDIPKAIDEGGQ
jgi:hypothetical protein